MAGISGGGEVEVHIREGRIELEPVTVAMRVAKRGSTPTIEAESDMPALTAAEARAVLEHVRR